MLDVKTVAKKIDYLAKEIKICKQTKERMVKAVEELKKRYPDEAVFKQKLNEVLRGKEQDDWLAYFDGRIADLLKGIEDNNNQIVNELKGVETEEEPTVTKTLFHSMDKKTRNRYLKEFKIEEEYLEHLRPKEEEKVRKKDYTLYESNPYAKVANAMVEWYSTKLIKKYPTFYDNICHSLRTSDIKILSKSYTNMMLFYSIAIAVLTSLITPLLLKSFIIFRVFQSLILGMAAGGLTFGIFYIYPLMQANTRRRQIKNDLPFVIIHMSAVAGSGAQPIAMFNLIVRSGEYKGLEGEVKKIVNYVNLFGYNLSTALRAVSLTTPSSEFKELLTGLITTIESGGSLKEYLTAKASDAMVDYKLERQKYVETLSTYSDVYTGILIAAPLLFFVTLAIIQMMGGAVMGVSAKALATIGTFGILPACNLGFVLFLNLTQPE